MENNHLYNLLTQLTQEMKSLWRIEKHYIDEALSEEEKIFWQRMRDDKRTHVEDIKQIVKQELM